MDRDRMEGKLKEGTGFAKDKVGEATGDEEVEARGEAERAEGKGQGALGKVKDAVDKAKDTFKR